MCPRLRGPDPPRSRDADAARNYTRGRIEALLGVITTGTGDSLERLRRNLDTANKRVAQLLSDSIQMMTGTFVSRLTSLAAR